MLAMSLLRYDCISYIIAKPIDLLARYISAEDDDLAIEMHEPYTYLNVCITIPVQFSVFK